MGTACQFKEFLTSLSKCFPFKMVPNLKESTYFQYKLLLLAVCPLHWRCGMVRGGRRGHLLFLAEFFSPSRWFHSLPAKPVREVTKVKLKQKNVVCLTWLEQGLKPQQWRNYLMYCIFWDTGSIGTLAIFAKIIVFTTPKFWDIQKNSGKNG